MANPLDEVNDPIAEQGRDVNVIQKQIPVKVGVGSTIFEVFFVDIWNHSRSNLLVHEAKC